MRAEPSAIEVLHLCECYVGGVRTHLDLVLPELVARGFAVEAWISLARDAEAERHAEGLERKGVRVRRLALSRGVSWRKDREVQRALAERCADTGPRIVHSHGSKAGLLARRAPLLAHAARVHTPHGFAFLKRAEFGALRRAAFRAVERRLAARTDALVAVSAREGEAARTLGFPSERVRVLRNGIRLPPAAGPEARRAARAALGLSSDGKHLLVAGIFMREKGHELALRALARAESAAWTAWFVGDGPRRPALEALQRSLGLRSRVRFVGAARELDAWIEACDLALLPSHSEGFPYVALETLARERPLLASAVGGLLELWDEGAQAVAERLGAPLLLTNRDPGAWARALGSWAANDAAREQLGVLGRRRVASAFPLEAQVAGLASLYAELVSGRGALDRR